jgi:hypothetical protein
VSQLGQVLQAAGFVVDDHPVRGRPTLWRGVRYVTLHHYAGSEDPDAGPREAYYLRWGGLHPPNAHLYVDLTGKVWVIAQALPGQPEPGRATHMGEGQYPGIPRDQGNAMCLGIEVQCDGSHPLATHATSWPVVLRLMATLLDEYRLPTDNLIGHKEYAGQAQGKIDPIDDMDQVRDLVQQQRDTPTQEGPIDMFLAASQNGSTTYLVGPVSAVQVDDRQAAELEQHGVPRSQRRISDELIRHLIHNPSARGGVRPPGLDHVPGDYTQ